MSQFFKSNEPDEVGIATINSVSPNGAGNFSVTSSGGTIAITSIASGQNIEVTNPAPPFAASKTVVWVDSAAGSNTTGTGTAINPYQTITFAMASITTNSITNPFCIAATGIFAETPALKPWVSLVGTSIGSTRVTAISLDSTWNNSTGVYASVENINFTSSLSLSITGTTGTSARLTFNNCLMSNIGFTTSRTAIADTIIFKNSSTGIFQIQDANGEIYSSSLASITNAGSVSATGARTLRVVGSIVTGNATAASSSGQTMTITFSSTRIGGNASTTGSGAIIYDADSIPSGTLSGTTTASPVLNIPIGGLGAAATPTSGNILVGNGSVWTSASALPPATLGTATHTVYVDSGSGNDTTGTGNAIYPYATITKALSTITTASATNTYAIVLQGLTTESVVIKPWVSLVGNGNLTCGFTGNATLDASWGTATSPAANISNIRITGTISFTISGAGTSPNLILSNCFVTGAASFTGRSGSDFFQAYNTEFASTTTAQDCLFQSYSNTYDGTVLYRNSIAPSSTFWQSSGDLFNGAFNVTAGVAQSISAFLNASRVSGGSTVTGATANITYDATAYATGGITLVTSGTATPNLVPLRAGGTNANLTASNGGIFYSTASAGAILSGTATAGQMLRSGATAAPTWSTATFPATATGTGTILRADGTNWSSTTATYPATTTINQILYSSANNTISEITAANNAAMITSATGVPSMTALGNLKVLASNATGVVAGRSLSVNIVSITASTTYTSSTGCVSYWYEMCGGGGGGGGTALTSGSQFAAAAGGGGGEYVMGSSSTPSAGISVTIGTAGAGGSAGANNGTAGGTTTFGSVTALGGAGGTGRTAQATGSSTVGAVGGTGGVGGTVRFAGESGDTGNCVFAGGFTNGGGGGGSRFGVGGGDSVASAGFAGLGNGSGGGGSSAGASQAAFAGGNGTVGILVVYELIVN